MAPQREQHHPAYTPSCAGYEDKAHRMWHREAGAHFCPHCGVDLSALSTPDIDTTNPNPTEYIPPCRGYEAMAHRMWRDDTGAHYCPQCGTDISSPPSPEQ